jgi:signal transduction histidine kinase
MLIRNSGVPSGVWIAATGRPLIGTDGAVLGACVVFRDITSERSSEQAISRAHTELQAAQQRQSELSTFLVHDLKSPLTGILGSVGMLLDGPQPPDERECLLDIRDSARSMHRMVLDILDVHTAEDGVLSVHLQNVNLKALLEQVHAVMSPRASLRKQRLEIASLPEHRTVSVDPNLLVRVLQNLVDNCIKYGPSGGYIWIDAELGTHMLTLRVRDEGPGVPPALRERIFEKYARLERDLAARHRDSRGLGLRFCRVAADAHGGRIWVEDNLPQGACFVLELPLRGPVP